MTAEEFRRSRRMWAVVDGTLLLAGADDPRSHYEWLRSLLGERGAEAYKTSTRGYVKDGVMAAYKPHAGDDFSRWVDKAAMILAYGVLGGAFRIEEFWLGVRNPGRPGGQWDPVCRVPEGWLNEYLNKACLLYTSPSPRDS